MEFLGQYIGLGEGDRSPALPDIKRHLKRKFTPARNTLDESDLFTPALTAEVKREQGIFMGDGRLRSTDIVVPGVINLAFKYACGFMSREVILPLHFSVEGHMSDMWIGPAAYVGQVLSAEGRALHMPTAYDRFALPFKNKTGVDELAHNRIGPTNIDIGDGKFIKFPKGTPWTFSSFSQGSMIWFDFYHQYLAPGKPLNWRLPDLRAAIVCGDPNREQGVCVDWIEDKPADDHQGIMDVRWENTPWWMLELARTGDMYTDNSPDERGLNKTAIAKIITQNKWSGGPAGLLSRVSDLVTPMDDLIPVTLSLYDAIRFGLGGIQKHGGYDMEPAVQFCRERLSA